MPQDNAPDHINDRITVFRSILEPLAKATVGAVAVCYGIGLLIKNLYLAGWSVEAVKFVYVDYALSGALFLLLGLLGISFWSLFVFTLRKFNVTRLRQANRDERGAFLRLCVKATLLLLVEFLFLGTIIATMCSHRIGSVRYCLSLLLVTGWPAGYFIVKKFIAELLQSFASGRKVPGDVGMRLFLNLVLFVFIILSYVRVIYPSISQAYGGGEHLQIKLRVTKDGTETLEDAGFKAEPSRPHLFSAEAISQDDMSLTLVAPRVKSGVKAAVQIRRDQVVSVLTSMQ